MGNMRIPVVSRHRSLHGLGPWGRPEEELRSSPELPRDASAQHLASATTAVVNAALAKQVQRSLEAWEAQRHWAHVAPKRPMSRNL